MNLIKLPQLWSNCPTNWESRIWHAVGFHYNFLFWDNTSTQSKSFSVPFLSLGRHGVNAFLLFGSSLYISTAASDNLVPSSREPNHQCLSSQTETQGPAVPGQQVWYKFQYYVRWFRYFASHDQNHGDNSKGNTFHQHSTLQCVFCEETSSLDAQKVVPCDKRRPLPLSDCSDCIWNVEASLHLSLLGQARNLRLLEELWKKSLLLCAVQGNVIKS